MVNNNRLEPAGSEAAALQLCANCEVCVCFCLARSVIRKVIEMIKLRLDKTVLARGKSLTAAIYIQIEK